KITGFLTGRAPPGLAWTVIKSRLGDSPDFDLPIPGEAGRCPAGEESGDFRDKVRVEADNQKREPEENSGAVERAPCRVFEPSQVSATAGSQEEQEVEQTEGDATDAAG